MKQQFNVYLEPALVARIKHRAIDASISLSGLVTEVFRRYLLEENAMSGPLTVQPLVHHAGNMSDLLRFYEALGASVVMRSRDDDFALVRIAGTELALLVHPPNPDQSEDQVELAFACDEPLTAVEADLRAKGVTIVRGAADEAFGEQLQVESPDGLLIKINRLEPPSFT